MGYSYKSYSDTKEVFKKFVNAAEGQAVYLKSEWVSWKRQALRGTDTGEWRWCYYSDGCSVAGYNKA